MTKPRRFAVIVALALAAGACVQLGHIQQTKPIRSLQFNGSPKDVVQCVQQRLGGKVQEETLGERWVIYDSAKTHHAEGMTHYAITVGRAPGDKGFAEWRIMRPPPQPGMPRGAGALPLTQNMVQQYWGPVQECAKKGEAPL
jgi:hypothetical protein